MDNSTRKLFILSDLTVNEQKSGSQRTFKKISGDIVLLYRYFSRNITEKRIRPIRRGK